MQRTFSLFVSLWLVVNDRKFLVGTVFFSYTNQPTVFLHEPAMIRTSQPNMLLALATSIGLWFLVASDLLPNTTQRTRQHGIRQRARGIQALRRRTPRQGVGPSLAQTDRSRSSTREQSRTVAAGGLGPNKVTVHA